ncbi:hypothetical protein TSUD_111980 [Trifolium subterraneum]|uniref:Uncharacterized protein n=1 Tax=Trifolium subterraneum TaxID=3900 RepID=A0A2Z6M2R4_TRISU|nr:hypothetical protein TSUD_111980 [Trifolium subterraneum]
MVNTSLTIDQGSPSFNFLPLPPSTVMRTTSIPANVSDNIEFHFLPKYNASRSRNLTSSGLIGNIAPAISNLRDLSNNSLTGAMPDFLSQLRFLRVLNLEGNQLSGAIPMQLLVRSENSRLKSNFGGNPNLCSSGSCNKMNKAVVPLVASLGGAFMILAVATISFRIYYKRHQVSYNVSKLGGYSRIKQELESKKQEFTYEEVLSITRNFEKVVGKGASGIVYHDKNENILSWNQRLQIAVDTAEGE